MPITARSQPQLELHSEPPQEQGMRVFYGGTTKDEILNRGNDRIGIQHWAREGITGRGVLIDYASWAAKRGIEYLALSRHSIKLRDIIDIAQEEQISFERGDILLIRSGFTNEWNSMSLEAKQSYADWKTPEHAGVEATTEILEWIWNTGFSAVAGDAVSFEVFPPTTDFMLHEYLIAGWGMPIGKSYLEW